MFVTFKYAQKSNLFDGIINLINQVFMMIVENLKLFPKISFREFSITENVMLVEGV